MTFYAIGDCGCGSTMGSSIPSQVAAPTAICDDRYLTLQATTDIKLIGVNPGTNCQATLTSPTLQSFVVSDGLGVGFKTVSQPTVSLPAFPTLISSVVQTLPFLLGATGADPTTPWVRVVPPGSGTWLVQATSAGFSLIDSGTIPGLPSIFAAAATSTHPEILGFTESSPGSGVFVAKKLTGVGTGDQPAVVRYNGSTGRYELTGLASTDVLKQPKIQCNTFFGLNDDGTNTAGGFAVRPDSGVTQANIDFLAFDTGTNKLYRAAPDTISDISSSAASGTIAAGVITQPTPHLAFGSLPIHYPNIRIQATVEFSTIETPIFYLYVDGVLTFTWDYTLSSVAAANKMWLFNLGKILTGITLGSRTIDIRVKTVSNSTIVFSQASLETIRTP